MSHRNVVVIIQHRQNDGIRRCQRTQQRPLLGTQQRLTPAEHGAVGDTHGVGTIRPSMALSAAEDTPRCRIGASPR